MSGDARSTVALLNPVQVDLDLGEEPVDLRMIFERSGLSRHGWDFEGAMHNTAVRICIERTAQAVARARKRKHRRAVHSAPITRMESA